MPKKRRKYTVTLTIEDDGSFPRIPPSRLWEHTTLRLPTGLDITGIEVTDRPRKLYVLFNRHGDGGINGVTTDKETADKWKFWEDGRDQAYRHIVEVTEEEIHARDRR